MARAYTIKPAITPSTPKDTAGSNFLAAPVKCIVVPVVRVSELLVVGVGDTNSAVVAIGGIMIVDERDKAAEVNGTSVPIAVASLKAGEGVLPGSISSRSKSVVLGLRTLIGNQPQRTYCQV